VRKLAKVFLIVFGLLLALAAIGVLGINLYVQSAGTQSRIEREISAALGTPVHMTGSSLTPWGGLKISGVTVPQPDGNGNFLEASSFAAFFEFLPLMRKQIIVDQVNIDTPKVVWIQNESGKWRMPAENEEKAPREKPVRETEHTEKLHEKKSAPFSVTVKKFRLDHGAFVFLDQKQRHVIAFDDVQVDCPSISGGNTEGSAKSDKVVVREELFLQNVSAPFSFTDGELSLHDVSAQIADGKLDGACTLQTAERHSPFTVDVHFDGINVDRLLTEAGQLPGVATGALNGWVNLYGHAGEPESIAGSGHISLVGGTVRYGLFQMLGSALQINDLVLLNIQQAHADFRASDSRVHVDDLLLQTQNLKVAAHGDITFDGKMQLDARLTINQRIHRQLPGFIKSNFQQGEDSDTRYIDFVVDGTVGKPHTDLWDRVGGAKIQKEVTGIFQSIFGGKRKPEEKKKEKKPKKKEGSEALATPSISAEPSATPMPSTAE